MWFCVLDKVLAWDTQSVCPSNREHAAVHKMASLWKQRLQSFLDANLSIQDLHVRNDMLRTSHSLIWDWPHHYGIFCLKSETLVLHQAQNRRKNSIAGYIMTTNIYSFCMMLIYFKYLPILIDLGHYNTYLSKSTLSVFIDLWTIHVHFSGV